MLFRFARSVGGSTNAAFNKNIVAVGDSLTFGFGVSSPYPARIAAHYSSTAWNFGHGGYGWYGTGSSSLTPLGPTEVDPALTSPPQTLILFAGSNDLAGGVSITDTYNAMMSYRAARVAAGYNSAKIICVTMLPRSGNAYINETLRANYNALIVNGASTYGYSICRADLDSRIGLAGCNLDMTYYLSDTLHLNDTGQAVLAGLIEAVMGS